MKTAYKKKAGFTLVELITAMAIMAILVGIAVPAYDGYTRKTMRTTAKTTLERIRALTERYYLNNKSYTSDLTNLGFGAAVIEIEKSGEEVAAGSSAAGYQVMINAPGVFCPTCAYEIGAIPRNGQIADTDCMTLFINSRNQKGASGPKGVKCW